MHLHKGKAVISAANQLSYSKKQDQKRNPYVYHNFPTPFFSKKGSLFRHAIALV